MAFTANFERFRGAAVLVTGGLGFIGSRLAARLVELGARVTLVDSLIPEYGGNPRNVAGIADKVRINVSDVRDAYAMRHLVQGQDFLFNLAGQTSHMDSMADPITDLEINAKAQLSILEACRKENPGVRIVFASTRQLYGRPEYLPVDEKHPVRPVDVNGVNKLAGEQFHLLYDQVYGLRAAALRLTNTYGPGMRIKDARQTFLGVWLRLAIEGQPFEVWGGEQLRDYTYVDDAVDAHLRAALGLEQGVCRGRVYNVGGERPVSLLETARILARAAGRNEAEAFVVREFPAERKKIDIGDYYCDDALIRTELGWRPEVSLEDGLAASVEYFRANLSDYL